jgi:hypothetical protein
MENDDDYYARRAAEERAAAERATDAWVRDVHLQLAEEYERRASTVVSINLDRRTGRNRSAEPRRGG